jgi:putative SOS response-associated peptidase YedK
LLSEQRAAQFIPKACSAYRAQGPKWLGEEPATEEELLAMLKPCLDEALKIWAVDKTVGNVRNKGPQLAMPI